jgi:hypothetical protein
VSQPPNRDQRQARTGYHETRSANRALLFALALALGLIFALVWTAAGPVSPTVRAMPGDPVLLEPHDLDFDVIRVATTGENTPACGTEEEPCRTVQYAADKALPGDEIRVAAGTYTGTNDYGGLSQLVYLTKTLTIRGGYSTTDWTAPDPAANPTTLDAEGEGRVMLISPTITVHLEGMRFVGGDATGLGGGPTAALGGEPPFKDAGGGLYILTATVTVSGSMIFSNTAGTGAERPGCGGGLYARGGSVTLLHNKIVSNTAGYWYGFGGGIYLEHGGATFVKNEIVSNTASIWGDGYGGGLYLYGGVPPQPLPSASLLDNRFQGNYGSRTADGWGGGMQVNHYRVELLDNLVQYNTGGTASEGKGGGLYIFFSEAHLERNLVRHNTASLGEEGISGGVHFCTCPTVTLKNNTIFSNAANTFGNGYGGGVSFCKTTATLDSNTIISNTATFSTALEVRGWGGGVWTGDGTSLSLSNDLIAGNHAKTQGSGLWFGVENDDHNDRGIRLQHVTIADNAGGIGHGVYVTHAVAFLTNTIIAGHPGVGVFVASGGEATLEATLWYNNDRNTAGRVEAGDLNYYDLDPAFVDPEDWDYHIGPDSAALDRGVGSGVHSDMDGEHRPWLAPDLGADEIWPFSPSFQAYLPLILRQSSGE